VPYLVDDLVTAIALKEIYDAPLCCYLMDDQNVSVSAIPDALMREFLAKCGLRLTTHPEMRVAYENKFGLRFWLLPAVVPGDLISTGAEVPSSPEADSKTGALVGSIWSQAWFDLLLRAVGPSGRALDWYGNNKSPYFQFPPDQLESAHIRALGIAPEPELAARLRAYPYTVVPTGTLQGESGNALAVAQLSLPGRILFIAATSNTPVIILGSEETPASRFVKRFDIGVTAEYTPEGFRRAVERVTDLETQRRMRRNAAAIANTLSSRGICEWLANSIERGQPSDLRFEDLLPRQESDMVAFIEPPVPDELYREYRAIYEVARRLRGRGLRPDFVIDVGASQGIWSYAVSRFFPDARFILVDPLVSRYDRSVLQNHMSSIPRVEYAEVAISNKVGRASFQVPRDLYGASLLHPTDFRTYDSVEIAVTTLDQLASERDVTGRGILKADVQFAEHLVLEGARELLPRLDAIVLELSLLRYEKRAQTFLEMLNLLDSLGFRYWDDAGCWRSPVDGMLLQKDVLFIRKGLCMAEGAA
jgi:FkbM family methyltransferase